MTTLTTRMATAMVGQFTTVAYQRTRCLTWCGLTAFKLFVFVAVLYADLPVIVPVTLGALTVVGAVVAAHKRMLWRGAIKLERQRERDHQQARDLFA